MAIPLVNGVYISVTGTTVDTVFAFSFTALPLVKNAGDGETYAIIPGACNVGVSMQNTTAVKKYAEVSYSAR
jgi:hypothetical protein